MVFKILTFKSHTPGNQNAYSDNKAYVLTALVDIKWQINVAFSDDKKVLQYKPGQ